MIVKLGYFLGSILFFAILKVYWQICLFRKGPQDSPYSKVLGGFAAVLLIALLLFQLHVADLDKTISFDKMVIRSVALVAGIAIYTALVLQIADYTNRLVQTVTSLIFTQVIVHSLAFPLILFVPNSTDQAGQTNFALVAIVYLVLVIFLNVWQLIINSHIFQQALSKNFGVGLLLSFGLLAFNLLLVNLV